MYHRTKNTLKLFCWMIISVISFFTFVSDAQVFRGYYPDGSLNFRSDRDVNTQTIRRYYPNGQLELVANYRNGKLDGSLRAYYENGMLKTDLPYNRGKLEGMARFYYDTGILMAKVEYKDGAETGRMSFYDSKGKATSPFALPKSSDNDASTIVKN